MKLPLSWLNEYVKIDDVPVDELADKLVGIGFEVEEIIFKGEGIENVVSAKVKEINPHPNADKLTVCELDIGRKMVTVVTGAKNFKVGDMVTLALDGARLPKDKTINAGELRGVMSYGMMCSGAELGIEEIDYPGAGVDGILILPSDTKPGIDIKEILGLNEYVLDVSITANRPDCQSIYGIALEISAVTGRKIKPLNLKYKTAKSDKRMSIEIDNYNLCSRYTLAIIDNVKVAPSPELIRKRLRLVGHKPINNVVDITNYVLAEVGQPLHAFDFKMVQGGIFVREANAGESIKTLDAKEYNLNAGMLVIADKAKPLSIAGIMGGEFSSINNNTECVLLESARFSRGSIRTSARQLGLRTDSSARFEKGVDWFSVDIGRERALALISELKIGDVTTFGQEDGIKEPVIKTITTSCSQICGVLGIKIESKRIVEILNALEIETECESDGTLTCIIPMFREDIDNFTDLAEEIIRFYGYDKIESNAFKPSAVTIGGLSQKQQRINKIKNLMVSAGCYEVVSYSFVNMNQYDLLNITNEDKLRNTIKILNPLSEEFSVMRTQMVGSMLGIVHTNTSKMNNIFRIFEVSRTYNARSLPLKSLPDESETLCAAFCGANETFYDIKDVITEMLALNGIEYSLDYSKKGWLHPGISADIMVGNKCIGGFGKIHPLVAKNFDVPETLFLAEISIDLLLDKESELIRFAPLPKYPFVERDLAFTVAVDTPVGALISLIEKSDPLVEEVGLFDVYQGEQIQKGFKSVAFSVKLRSADKTLTEQEIQVVINKIISDIEAEFNAKLRS